MVLAATDPHSAGSSWLNILCPLRPAKSSDSPCPSSAHTLQRAHDHHAPSVPARLSFIALLGQSPANGGHVAQHPAVTFWCPQLPPSPQAAMALVAQGIASWPWGAMAVIGSSLGGFYASWVAQHAGCPSVMLQPAGENLARDLARYVGEQTSWHDPAERFYFLPDTSVSCRRWMCAAAHPLRVSWPSSPGDEVLDWREMVAATPRPSCVCSGGDHALSDFTEHLEPITRFLRLA